MGLIRPDQVEGYPAFFDWVEARELFAARAGGQVADEAVFEECLQRQERLLAQFGELDADSLEVVVGWAGFDPVEDTAVELQFLFHPHQRDNHPQHRVLRRSEAGLDEKAVGAEAEHLGKMAAFTGAEHAGEMDGQAQITTGMFFQVFLNQGEKREEVRRDPERLMRNRNVDGRLPLLQDDERAFPFADVAVHCPGERTVRLQEQPGAHNEKIRRCLPDEFHELCRTGGHEDPISPVAQDDFES
jgi:hypothetical protein